MNERDAVLELLDSLGDATEKAQAVLELLRNNGGYSDNFSIPHPNVLGALWVLDDQIKHIQGQITCFRFPAANDD
jgi:hypothetical protein